MDDVLKVGSVIFRALVSSGDILLVSIALDIMSCLLTVTLHVGYCVVSRSSAYGFNVLKPLKYCRKRRGGLIDFIA